MIQVKSIDTVNLKMWTSKSMPEAEIGKDGKMVKDEKGKVVSTGKMLDYTEYYFVDMVGNLLKILTKNSEFRQYEGQDGILFIKLEIKEFQGKSEKRFTLADFVPVKK